MELCGLPPCAELEGRSLVPLLREPNAAWPYPTLTTHGRNNHSVRSARWRYIRYADASEELYDHSRDPLEWENLADRPESSDTKRRLAAALPTTDAPESPGVTEPSAEKRPRQ